MMALFHSPQPSGWGSKWCANVTEPFQWFHVDQLKAPVEKPLKWLPVQLASADPPT